MEKKEEEMTDALEKISCLEEEVEGFSDVVEKLKRLNIELEREKVLSSDECRAFEEDYEKVSLVAEDLRRSLKNCRSQVEYNSGGDNSIRDESGKVNFFQ